MFNTVIRRSNPAVVFPDAHFLTSDHGYGLVEALVSSYVNIRGRHVAKTRNVSEASKRYRLTKQILFQSM